MGTEMDKIEKVKIYDRKTGEKIGEFDPPLAAYTEENSKISEDKIVANKSNNVCFTATATGTITSPPRPNIKMIISPGDQYRNGYTVLCFYRPKYYNWFQRLMYKMCFGITIKQGDEVKREFL